MKRVLLFCVLLLALGTTSLAQSRQRPTDLTDHQLTMREMVDFAVDLRTFGNPSDGFYEAIGNSDDPLYIAPLIDVGYFIANRPDVAIELYTALNNLTGQPADRGWIGYFEWASANDIAVPEGYDEFKGDLFSTFVDPEFNRFFRDGTQETATVNLLEAVWGGVRVDGIPSLVNARQITPEEATEEGERLTGFCNGDDCSYPAEDELVFGVYLDGDARAYPLRLLNWHEMFNDVIGHTPLHSAPDGEFLCNFRAPTEIQVFIRDGDWVQIEGYSAGCPDSGWVRFDDIESAGNLALLPRADQGDAPRDIGFRARVTGRPVMLAYCTLCGSGILYDATLDDVTYTDLNGDTVELGDVTFEFGSTGMLMRSNKLMYDRTTDTVWNALTGVPAFGPLATTDIQLDLLPVVVTDWSSWLAQHPETSVLSLETGVRRDYTNGAAYSDYFNNPEFVMFPVFNQNEDIAQNKDMVFGLRFDEQVKAYPLDILTQERVTNDRVDGQDVVIITQPTPERDFFEPGGAAVRAYASDGLTFSTSDDATTVVDAEGLVWQVTEDALTAPDGRELPRLAGHLAFWFGWYSFYPDTLFYDGMS